MVLFVLWSIIHNTFGALDFLPLSEHHQNFFFAVVYRFQVEAVSVSSDDGIQDRRQFAHHIVDGGNRFTVLASVDTRLDRKSVV